MHNKAEFLNRFSSNAYEFYRREMRFHLRKSVVTSLRTADIFPVVASLPPREEKRQPKIRLLFAGYVVTCAKKIIRVNGTFIA